MPVRTHNQKAITQFGGIGFISFILAILFIVEYYQNPDHANAKNLAKYFIIAFSVSFVSGGIAYSMHYKDIPGRRTSVPV